MSPVIGYILGAIFFVVAAGWFIQKAWYILRHIGPDKRQTAEMNSLAVLTYRKAFGYTREIPIIRPRTCGYVFMGMNMLFACVVCLAFTGWLLSRAF